MDEGVDTEEEAWCAGERQRVVAYLKAETLVHGEVGNWPAWHVRSCVAIWAIESVKKPGYVGWWAVSGDLPTDYTTCGLERHPREGLRDIAARWRHAAECWAANKPVEGWSIGCPEDRPTLGPLLAARAELLMSWAADDNLWDD